MRCRLGHVALVGSKHRDGLPDRQAGSLNVGLPACRRVSKFDEREVRAANAFPDELGTDFARASTHATRHLSQTLNLVRRKAETDDCRRGHRYLLNLTVYSVTQWRILVNVALDVSQRGPLGLDLATVASRLSNRSGRQTTA